MFAALLCLSAFAPPAAADAANPESAPLPAPKVLADGVRVWPDLPYRTVDGETLSLDLALPAAPSDGAGEGERAEPTPLLAFVHGGGWVAGWKGRYKPEVLAAARRGRAAATVQYRLSRVGPGGTYVAPFPAALDDVRAALAFLIAHADELNLDPARIALVGDSAGGHLSLLAALSANEPTAGGPPRVPVAAAVNLFGVTDMPAYYAGSPHARTVLSLFLGGHLADRRGVYDAASPVRFVDAADPPVLTLHGTADPVVPFDQATRLHAALDAAGVPNELAPIVGGSHGLFRQRAAVWTRANAFLDAHLAPQPQEPRP